MQKVNRRTMLALSGAALAASAVPARASDDGEAAGAMSPREMIRERYFPNVVLTTHEGRRVKFYDDVVKDKIVTINMMYATCEGVCPRITSNLVRVQKLLGDRVGKDIHMISITLRPEQDTPEVLRKHVKMHNIGPGWTFLTGAASDIEMLRRRLGFVDPNPERDKDRANHIGLVRYGNEPRHVWSSCPGLLPASSIAEVLSWVDWPKGHHAAANGKGVGK
jgi:protein SCO1/2